LALVTALRRPKGLLKDKLTNSHSWFQYNGQWAVINQLKANLAIKSGMYGWSCDMHTQSKPR
jgi:hypothetical protein